MKIMTCPINGSRLISEFAYWGECKTMPDPGESSDAQWADYVFNKSGAPGLKHEWWCHTPSNTWFIAVRDTQSDVIEKTFLYGQQ